MSVLRIAYGTVLADGEDAPLPVPTAVRIERAADAPVWLAAREAACDACPHSRAAEHDAPACALLDHCRPCKYAARLRNPNGCCPDQPPRWNACAAKPQE